MWRRRAGFVLCYGLFAGAAAAVAAEPQDVPVHADVSYGPHVHQFLDVYRPKGEGPFPVVICYGAIWIPSKGPARLDLFSSHRCAVIAVQTRSMGDAQQDKVHPPISYVLSAIAMMNYAR